jgi:hypothetical protein
MAISRTHSYYPSIYKLHKTRRRTCQAYTTGYHSQFTLIICILIAVAGTNVTDAQSRRPNDLDLASRHICLLDPVLNEYFDLTLLIFNILYALLCICSWQTEMPSKRVLKRRNMPCRFGMFNHNIACINVPRHNHSCACVHHGRLAHCARLPLHSPRHSVRRWCARTVVPVCRHRTVRLCVCAVWAMRAIGAS